MKSLKVERITIPSINAESLHFVFKNLEWNYIDQVPWREEFPYKPESHFQIAHNEEFIFLHYKVAEDFVKATAIRANENVWEDSCVEFFISFDNRQTYYNFEFNVLGTGLIGFGPSVKTERNRLSAEIIDTVDIYTHLVKMNATKVWEIYLVIPKSIFGAGIVYENNTFFANFYKCGDGLPNPHFLAWNNIEFPKPNFHKPEFFGEIIFN